MTGPREELLSTGSMGPAAVTLLYSTVRKVVRVRNVPPPTGERQWTSDSLMEAAHAVFAERGPQRLLTLAARSTDEESFRALLWTLVANDLITQGRRSERGKLSERLKVVISDMDDVELRNGRFVSAPTEGRRDEVRFDELVAAASGVAVRVPPWDPLSAHSAPVADRESLEALVRVLLAKAGAGLRLGELVAVLAVRMGVHDAPELLEDVALESVSGASASHPARAAEETDDAESVLAQLTMDEQRALPYLDASAAELGAALGFGKTKAWQVQRSARLKLAQILQDSPDGARVLGRALELARVKEEAP